MPVRKAWDHAIEFSMVSPASDFCPASSSSTTKSSALLSLSGFASTLFMGASSDSGTCPSTWIVTRLEISGVLTNVTS